MSKKEFEELYKKLMSCDAEKKVENREFRFRRNSLINVMEALSRLEKEGSIRSLSVQRHLLNLEKEMVYVSFKALKI